MSYILTLDQGTTGTTAGLIDTKTFSYFDQSDEDFKQFFPQADWVEHDLDIIWKTIENTVTKLLKKNNLTGQEIVAIGITNQRETTCAFNKQGKALAPAIVWQDRRTYEKCQSLKQHEQKIKEKTGLPLDPYFSATKMAWLLENNTAVQKAYTEKNLLLGTIDSFLLYKLTGVHATEGSNASRTQLFNILTGKWDEELCRFFKIDSSLLAEVKPSFGLFGKTKNLSFLPDGIPVTGILGDQQSALFGQNGTGEGSMKCTYGTGAFLLLNTGTKPYVSNLGLLTTISYQTEKEIYYALEGSCYIAGAAVQWLRDNLKIINHAKEIENLAEQVIDLNQMQDILFLPFFTGLGSPYWKSEAKGTITGLSRGTTSAQLARACLEGIALSINDLIEAFRAETKLSLSRIKVDGGATQNNLLMQMQADISTTDIIRPHIIETTSYGAGLAAAVGAQILDIEHLQKFWKEEKIFNKETKYSSYLNIKKNNWKKFIEKNY
ncbi:MAG: glycerol kinase GlpK [Bacteriovoracaceae bacterium]|nr:glycerol kinase GlpK [Bacteriovoracaceae bacterium]